MPTVDELSDLHRRYLDLSNRFKAAWTFHQFLQGLGKILPGEEILAEPLNFQGLYGDLKALAKELNSGDASEVSRRLDDTARLLSEKVARLAGEDARVAPSLLRQFFDRVRNHDSRVLVQLLRAYLYVRLERDWEAGLVDKADFVATRLGQELAEGDMPAIERDPRQHREIWSSLWSLLGADEPVPETVEDAVREIRTLRTAMTQAETLDQLNELGLIDAYRSLKHSLGDRFYHPAILEEILRTNLFLKRAIGGFFEREEQRIAGEYQQVFELEREALRLDGDLGIELADFHDQVERFERRRQRNEVKLGEVAHLRARARELIPRLQQVSGRPDTGEPLDPSAQLEESAATAAGSRATDIVLGTSAHAETGESEAGTRNGSEEEAPAGTGAGRSAEGVRIRTAHADLLGEPLRKVLAFLQRTDWEDPPEVSAALPELNTLRLEAREVVAYRRLHEPDRHDHQLEQFLLEAAALRVRVTAQAEEILADSRPAGSDAVERTRIVGRELCRLAGRFERRLELLVQEAVEAMNAEEARELQHLRMRLLREFSGLWLLAFG